MEHKNYRCPKCGNRRYEVDEIRTTGSFLTKILNIQNKRFATVTCNKCMYTEIFKVESSKLGNVFDFFTN